MQKIILQYNLQTHIFIGIKSNNINAYFRIQLTKEIFILKLKVRFFKLEGKTLILCSNNV